MHQAAAAGRTCAGKGRTRREGEGTMLGGDKGDMEGHGMRGKGAGNGAGGGGLVHKIIYSLGTRA